MANCAKISGGDAHRGGRTERRVGLRLFAALSILMPCIAVAQATNFGTLYSFQAGTDGAQPEGGVVIGQDGALYGTTYSGGTSGYGIVFELVPSKSTPWQERVLHNFSGDDGANSAATLTFESMGVLYGTTTLGGAGVGTVFELAPPRRRAAPGRRQSCTRLTPSLAVRTVVRMARSLSDRMESCTSPPRVVSTTTKSNSEP